MINQRSNSIETQKRMENFETLVSEIDEQIPDEFQCCVCLDLLHKPVVLACGHISCLWCVFKAMDNCQGSHCPICRHLYNHLPNVCEKLHLLLLKLYPATYEERGRQTTEHEKEYGCISEENVEPSSIGESLQNSVPCNDNKTSIPARPLESSETNGNGHIGGNNLQRNDIVRETGKRISVADLLCSACKELLFRPVVLNCGHVYCESCIVNTVDTVAKCQDCRSVHPNGYPKVCLILEHFLEEQFSDLYALRRETLVKQGKFQPVNPSTCSRQAQQHATGSSSLGSNDYILSSSWSSGNGPKVHIGVGCDSCGMSPVIGERYRCKDCTERIGYDLCEACYNTPTKLGGRFNQQHKPEHKFEIIEPLIRGDTNTLRNVITQLESQIPEYQISLTPQDLETARALLLAADFHLDTETGSIIPIRFNDTSQDGEGPNPTT